MATASEKKPAAPANTATAKTAAPGAADAANNQTAATAGAANTAAAAKPAETKAAKKVPALKVTCAREGFRRGGHVWGKKAQTVKLSDLTEEQIAQIKGENLLAVVETEVDA